MDSVLAFYDDAFEDLSREELEACCSLDEATAWLKGLFMGEFNDDPSISQIIADGLISCVPGIGELPDARDICAISLRWYHDPQKMREVSEWVGMAGCAIGLVPVFGGALKAVLRLLQHKAGKFLSELPELVALLNRQGTGSAERWLKELNLSEYRQATERAIHKIIDQLRQILTGIRNTVGRFSTEARLKAANLINFFMKLRDTAAEGCKRAFAWLEEQLAKLKPHIDEAGTNTSRQTEYTYTPQTQGQPTRTQEAHLSHEPPPNPKPGGTGHEALDDKVQKAWLAQNAEMLKKDFPSFTDSHLATFATAPQKVSLRNETIWRVYGESKPNAQLAAIGEEAAGNAKAGGSWWGSGSAPQSAREWRNQSAVLDKFNADGKMIKITVVEGDIPGLKGRVARQELQKGRQFLPGGGEQVYIDRKIAEQIDAAVAGKSNGTVRLPDGTGLRVETIDHANHPAWKDVNGKYGWGQEISALFEYHTYALAPPEILPKGDAGTAA